MDAPGPAVPGAATTTALLATGPGCPVFFFGDTWYPKQPMSLMDIW